VYNKQQQTINYFRNVTDVDWGLFVKLALPGKVTRRAYKVFVIYDRVLTNALSDFEFDNPHLKLFYNRNKKSYLIIVQIHKKKEAYCFGEKIIQQYTKQQHENNH
jgi:hypothetical protein